MTKKNVCWAPPGKPSDRHCVVQDRADVVFFASSVAFPGNANDFFTEAQLYFQKKQPAVKVGKGDNLQDIIKGMNAAKQAAGKLPLGDVHIVAHGDESAWLMLAVPQGDLPTVDDSDMWDKASVTSNGLTVLDLLRIFRLQMDNKFVRLDAGVVDSFTRIIVYSCELGKIPHMLDVVSDVFGYSASSAPSNKDGQPGPTPQVIAPTAWVFFRRPSLGADPEIRLFDKFKFAMIPDSVNSPASFAPNAGTQSLIAEQLKALYPNSDATQIDNMVKLTKPWKAKAPADGWVELSLQDATTQSLPVGVDAQGGLWFQTVQHAELDGEGYVVPMSKEHVTISGIQEAEIKSKSKDVYAQIVLKMNRDKPWWNLKYWTVTPVKVGGPIPEQKYVAANPFKGTPEIPYVPRQYALTATFSGTLVSYFVMRVEGGKPVPFDPDGGTFVRSTYVTRNGADGYYRTDKYRNADQITADGAKLHAFRLSKP